MKKTMRSLVVGGGLLAAALSAVVSPDGEICAGSESDASGVRMNAEKKTVSEVKNRRASEGSEARCVAGKADEIAFQAVEPLDEAEIGRVRALMDEIVARDGQGLLDKEELEEIVAEMPGGGGIPGMARILSGLVLSGNAEDRIDAFTLLTVLRREWDAEIDDDGNGVADSGEGVNHDASAVAENDRLEAEDGDECFRETDIDAELESSVVMKMMTKGLADDESSVRDAAFDALGSLPSDERAALSLQVLGNDDDTLKLALLERQTDPSDEAAVTLNFHGLDSDSGDVRKLAAANIDRMFGMAFDSTESAFEWWEAERGQVRSR